MNPLFVVPSWQLPFHKHNELHNTYITHLEKYKKNNLSLPNISSTNTFVTQPNLHIDPVFEEFVKFSIDCVSQIKPSYNLTPSLNLGLSSMHGTISEKGGLFSPDMKGDDFITGLYFLHTPPASGQLCIKYNVGDAAYFRKLHVETDNTINNQMAKLPMPQGNIVLFPSYLDYFIAQNNSEESRSIIHFSFKVV